MPLDFPSSPVLNATYTSGTRTWQWDGVAWGLIASGIVGPTGPTGTISMYAGITAPSGWLLCDGSSVSRTTYANLFSIVTASKGSATSITVGNPCVVNLNNHGLVAGDAVYLTTTGALPTGLSANTTYYVQNPLTNSFNLNTDRANAIANSNTLRITTTAAGSGTHSVTHAPWGGITSSNFSIPDLRGRVGVARDNMGGSAAGRLATNASTSGLVMGLSSGEEDIVLTSTQLSAHAHTIYGVSSVGSENVFGIGGLVSSSSNNNTVSANQTPNSDPINIMQPYVLLNHIIKT